MADCSPRLPLERHVLYARRVQAFRIRRLVSHLQVEPSAAHRRAVMRILRREIRQVFADFVEDLAPGDELACALAEYFRASADDFHWEVPS